MNLLRKLAEEGQVPATADGQRNPSSAAESFRSGNSDISSSASSEVISSENGTEYSSPTVHDKTH